MTRPSLISMLVFSVGALIASVLAGLSFDTNSPQQKHHGTTFDFATGENQTRSSDPQNAIFDRPLFMRSRRAPLAIPVAKSTIETAPIEDMDEPERAAPPPISTATLLGIAHVGTKQRALLQIAPGMLPVWADVGDVFGDAKLVSIEKSSVHIQDRSKEKSTVLQLYPDHSLPVSPASDAQDL